MPLKSQHIAELVRCVSKETFDLSGLVKLNDIASKSIAEFGAESDYVGMPTFKFTWADDFVPGSELSSMQMVEKLRLIDISISDTGSLDELKPFFKALIANDLLKEKYSLQVSFNIRPILDEFATSFAESASVALQEGLHEAFSSLFSAENIQMWTQSFIKAGSFAALLCAAYVQNSSAATVDFHKLAALIKFDQVI